MHKRKSSHRSQCKTTAIVNNKGQSIDKSIQQQVCGRARSYRLYIGSVDNVVLRYILWCVYAIILIVFTPIYILSKLIIIIYHHLSPILYQLYKTLIIIIRKITKHIHKLISYIYENPQSITKLIKPIYTHLSILISYVSTKLYKHIRCQYANKWPIFNWIRQIDRQSDQSTQNQYYTILQQLKQHIQTLQNTKQSINKQIHQLEQTTLSFINTKQKLIQQKQNQIKQLQQKNDLIQIKYTNEKQKLQQLQYQLIKHKKSKITHQQQTKLYIQSIQTKHQQFIQQQQHEYQQQILKIIQQKKQQNNKLQQKLSIIKQSYQQLIDKKDIKINQYKEQIQSQYIKIEELTKEVIILREELQRVIILDKKNKSNNVTGIGMINEQNQQAQGQDKMMSRIVDNNKIDNETQTVSILWNEYQQQSNNQHAIIYHSQPLLKSYSTNLSQSNQLMANYHSRQKNDYCKLYKIKASMHQLQQGSQHNLCCNCHNNNKNNNYRQSNNHYRQTKNNDYNGFMKSSIKSYLYHHNDNIEQINHNNDNIEQINSQTIYPQHESPFIPQNNRKQQSHQITKLSNQQQLNNTQSQQQQSNYNRDNIIWWNIFIIFICLWSIYFFYKLYQLWDIFYQSS